MLRHDLSFQIACIFAPGIIEIVDYLEWFYNVEIKHNIYNLGLVVCLYIYISSAQLKLLLY